MWVFRLQLKRFMTSMNALFMTAGALLMGAAFTATGGAARNDVSGYFFTLSMFFAMFSTSLSSRVPREVIALSRPVKRKQLLIEHLGAVLALSAAALFAGSLVLGTKSSTADVFKGAMIDLLYITAFSATGLFIGTILRGWTREIVAVTVGFALLFVPAGSMVLDKTGSIWPLVVPTLGPFLMLSGYLPALKGVVYTALSSAIYISAAVMVYGRSDVG
ncbi:MAG: hypothetical protein J7L37_07910 [Thermococcus sp.]|nr:hypothetical protein [Thermococcus sp.]